MPGLSQYKPGIYPGPNEEGIYEHDPVVIGEWSDKYEPSDFAEADQKLQMQHGFANPARSFGDQVFHGMMQNIPREHWDKLMTFQDDEDNDMRMTIRELMELAKRLSPLQEGGPLYERQQP